uniref:Secreted protein n=1 Tax=Trypanosoma vivax (strain Y486) TaxID=1055687 RepID=G0TRL3_TRYVY|nr:conserved hypothetical protein, in T. vivax [Trypanosoma vivax Y486]
MHETPPMMTFFVSSVVALAPMHATNTQCALRNLGVAQPTLYNVFSTTMPLTHNTGFAQHRRAMVVTKRLGLTLPTKVQTESDGLEGQCAHASQRAACPLTSATRAVVPPYSTTFILYLSFIPLVTSVRSVALELLATANVTDTHTRQ